MRGLRRLDEAFEQSVERLIPRTWGVRRSNPWGGLIGAGVAAFSIGSVLLVVALLTDYGLGSPLIFMSLGMVALPVGIFLSRRWDGGHSDE